VKSENKSIDYYLNLAYKIEIIEDKYEGGFTIHCPELSGCITCAETIEEGVKMIEDAKFAWL